MRLHVHHETCYRYREPVSYSIQQLRLTPRSEPGQRVIEWQIDTPAPCRAQRDSHGNLGHLLALDTPHEEVVIRVSGVVETDDGARALPHLEGGLSPLAYRLETPLTRADAGITAFAEQHLGAAGPLRERLLGLMAAVRDRICYTPGSTDVEHTAAQAFAAGAGVCQDQAHLFIACCRAAGVPARYVSGYIFTDGDHAASHAWADAWLGEEEGWLSLDITHARPADGHHCRLAVGRDYLDACPVRGVRRGGGEEAMAVSVRVAASAQAIQQQQ